MQFESKFDDPCDCQGSWDYFDETNGGSRWEQLTPEFCFFSMALRRSSSNHTRVTLHWKLRATRVGVAVTFLQ